MKLFLDHCVPNRVAIMLTAAGHDAALLRECMATDAADPAVLHQAEELDAVMVSLNGDFADITAYPTADHLGMIALQIRNHPATIVPITQRLIDYLHEHPDRREMDGKLLLVEPHRIRVRA